MVDLLAQMKTYRDAVVAAGVRCVLDARDVNAPAVLIRPPTINYRFGRGCVGAQWAAWVYLIDAGQENALRAAFPMLETVNEALSTAGVAIVQAQPVDFQTADGGTVPGYILTWNT